MITPSVQVKFSDGSRWIIPVEDIAAERARYFAIDNDDSFDEVVSKEYFSFLADDSEIIEWFKNNLSWYDVKSSAERLPDVVEEPDYNREWSNADMAVVRTLD